MLNSAPQTSLPPPDAIRRTAEEIVARPYYDLGEGPSAASPPLWWEFLQWLLKPLTWLFDSLQGLPDFVRWLVVVVTFILLVALIAHIIYTFVVAIRGPAARRRRLYAGAPREVDPVELEDQAERAGSDGDYMEAIRLLFRAALRRIETAEKRKLRPGCTNRELLRRYQATPLFGALERFVDTIDKKWYGGGTCLQEDYLICRDEHARIQEYVQETRPAVGA